MKKQRIKESSQAETDSDQQRYRRKKRNTHVAEEETTEIQSETHTSFSVNEPSDNISSTATTESPMENTSSETKRNEDSIVSSGHSDTNSDTDQNSSTNEDEETWGVPDNYRYIPGYGVDKITSHASYTLNETTNAEDESTEISVISASLINQKLTIEIQVFSKTAPFWLNSDNPDFLSEQQVIRGVSSINNFVYYHGNRYGTVTETKNDPDDHFINIHTFECNDFEPEISDSEEIPLTVTLYDLPLSFTLVPAKEEQPEDNNLYKMKKYGGLMIEPRLENGHLKIAIYPLNKDDYITLPGLIRGAHGETIEDGLITATDSEGNVFNGSCIRYYPGCNTYFEWDFGEAAPGTYSLHIPFLCQIPAEYSDPITIPLNFTNQTWNPQIYDVPGGQFCVSNISEPDALTDYTYQKVTLAFRSNDEKHRIQTLYGTITCDTYPSCELPNGVSTTITEEFYPDDSKGTATFSVKTLNDIQDPSTAIFHLSKRTKNSLYSTPFYYRWNESFNFTFSVE